MAKMKYWNGTTWEILDAKDADTETDSDTITFKSGLEAGDMVLLQWLETA